MILEPQIKMATDFLSYIAADEDISFRTFSDREEGNSNPRNFYGKFKNLSQKLILQNRAGSGVFWVVNRTDGPGTTDASIVGIRALFVDLDGAPIEPVLSAILRPQVVLETSSGKFHAYWVVKPGITPQAFTVYQKALAEIFGGDRVVSNPSRVMRLPGFYHQKNEPYLSKICRLEDHIPPYDPEDVIKGFNLKRVSELVPEVKPMMVAPYEGGVIPNGQRDNTLIKRAACLRNAGLGYYQMLEILRGINKDYCEVPLPDRQVQKIAASAAKMDSYATQDLVPPIEKKKPKYMTFQEVAELDDEGIKWAIPDLLPQGLTVLAGSPKMGKSWLVQQLSYSVAIGGVALGKFPTIQGSALHLALEDPVQRFRKRQEQQQGKGAINPKDGYFANEWEPLPRGIDDIREWCDTVKNPRLVIIDTLARFTGETDSNKGGTLYNTEYKMMAHFHRLAVDYGISVLVVHHLRKADASDPMSLVSGSAGITGAADLVWVFFRKPERNEMRSKLRAMGKDVGDTTYDLVWNEKCCQWRCNDFTNEDESRGIRDDIKKIFKDLGDKLVTASQIADQLNRSKQYVSRELKAFANDEFIVKVNGDSNTVYYKNNPDLFAA
jgi:hypothetical protein